MYTRLFIQPFSLLPSCARPCPASHGQTTLLLLAAVAPSPEPLHARARAEAAAETAAAGDQGREGNADRDEDEPPREEARAVALPARADGRALVVILQGGGMGGQFKRI